MSDREEEDDERSKSGSDEDDNEDESERGGGGRGRTAASDDDDEGEDISAERKRGKKGGDDDDSSEEEEDDPEEARKIAEGFIVDEDDSEAEARKKRKGKKKKRRREHSRDSSPDALSEDDLDLLAENTGAARPSTSKPSAPKPKKLLRRRRSNSIPSSLDSDASDEAALPNVNDLARIFEDLPRKRREAAMMDDDDNEDDMGDFIEEDEDPLADKGEEGDKERRKREKERKRRRKEKAAGLGGVKRGGEGGIDKAAWDDIYDVFGNGDDYDWALEGEEEMMGGAVEGEQPRMEDVFEPSEIQARHLTESDHLIRVRDIPERHQLLNSTLSTHPSYVPDPFPAFPPTGPAALWIASRISPRTKTIFHSSSGAYFTNADAPRPDLFPRFLRSIEKSLEFMFADQMEVPFVWEHRRDYLVYWINEENKEAPEGAKIDLLRRDELWRVYELGVRYRTLMERKAGLIDVWRRLSPRLAGTDEQDAEDSDGMDIEDEEGGDGKKQKKIDPRRIYLETQVLCSGGTAEESVEGVVDGMEYLASRYAQEVKEMREEEAESQTEGKPRVYKKNSGETALDMLRQSRLSRFVKDVGISVEEVVSINFSGNNLAFQDDPAELPEVYADQFIIEPKEVFDQASDKFIMVAGPLPTVEKVLGAARSILSQDMYKNPTLRKLIRALFRERGLVTIIPTEKGIAQIDEYHPFYPFKYTKGKPVADLAYSSRFLLMLEAEKESLVTIKFSLPPDAINHLEEQIYSAYKSDSFSAKAEAWNAFRKSVVTNAVRHGLVPVGATWVKEWLRAEVEDFVARSCAMSLEEAANQSPFKPRSHDKGDSPSVLAISHGMGDRAKDAVMCVYLDEEGRVRETIKVDTLFEDKNAMFKMDEDPDAPKKTTPIDEFKALLTRRKPSLIVMGGFSVSTNHLTTRVRSIVEQMAESVAQENLRYDASDEDRQREIDEAKTPVIFVPDNVARIYMNSARAQKEFSTLPPTGRFCVGLGRYAQSPIHEFCALGSDITAITFQPDAQKLVPREKLLLALERAIVNVVNDVGVLINDVISDTYMQYTLPFVSGFGPRKAAQLIKDIVKNGGSVTNRLELLSAKLLSPAIFDNAAAFLEIKSDPEDLELSGEDVAAQLDPLDNTRIHPADYEFARKMAENALELDEEDVTDDHPSKSVVRLMNDESNAEKLSELNLDDFAENLREIRNVEKRHALEVIKDEILAPGKDRRADFHVPNAWEILTMLTGETPDTLRQGVLVTGRVQAVRDTEAFIQLPSGIEAVVEVGFVSDLGALRCGDVLSRGATVQAVIVEVGHADLRVKLSLRQSELQHETVQSIKPVLEEPYDHDLVETHAAQAKNKKRRDGGAVKRQIDHPNFFNMNGGQAEQHLATQQRGDVVIRPSSKGPNHLAVTWKVDDGVYQHLDVEEFGEKPNQASLAPILRVSGKYTYHDLDELIVNHVKATVHSLEELMKSDKFKGKTLEELDSFLKTFVLAHPGKSIYAFGLDRNRPGYFVLGFLNKSTSDGGVIQRWPVRVNPGSYQLGDAELPGVLELCNAFKVQYSAKLAAGAGQGGRTPGHRAGGGTPAYGGRTPGGRTPGGGMTPGGARPLAAGNGSVYLPNGQRVGATPNPYISTGMTPYGAGMSAQQPYMQQSQQQPYGVSSHPQQQMSYGQPQPVFGGGYPSQQQQQQFPPQQQPPFGEAAAGLPPNPNVGGGGGPVINPARAAMINPARAAMMGRPTGGGGGY